MDPSAAEELSDVLKNLVSINGCVEKLNRGRWTDRYITISVSSASIHYYLSKNDQQTKKVRGIYPLMGARVEEEHQGNSKKHFPFTIFMASTQKIRFRTDHKVETHAWCMIISFLATKTSQKQDEPIDGVLNVKSGIGWSRRLASLDVNSKTFTLGKTIRQSEGNKPVETFSLEGASVRPVKSYGKTFEFELSMTSASGKPVDLRIRAATEEDRVMWCQAMQSVMDGQRMLELSPCRGQEEGFINIFESTEPRPGVGDVVPVVILTGLRDFSQRISMKINHYLHPHHIIHSGNISKVYHTNLKTVSIALKAAGFNFSHPSVEGSVYELQAKMPVTIASVTTISTIINVVWPRLSSKTTLTNSPSGPYHSDLLPSSLISRNITSARNRNLSQSEPEDNLTLVRYSSQSYD